MIHVQSADGGLVVSASIDQISTVQEANVARKRKAASPVKDGPDAKRQAPVEVANDAAAKAPQVCYTFCYD